MHLVRGEQRSLVRACRSRKRNTRRMHAHRDDGLFESLESGWHHLACGVEATWTNIASSATNLLPISEEHGLEGDRICMHQSGCIRSHGLLVSNEGEGMKIAPNSGVMYYASARNHTASPSNLTASSLPASGYHSPLPSQDTSSGYTSLRSTANTVACFGAAAETYHVKGDASKDAQRREVRSMPRTPRTPHRPHGGRVSSAPYPDVASAEQRMWNSLPATADGSFKIPKQKDMCDKATRSKIETWMSTASPVIQDDVCHGQAADENKASGRSLLADGLQGLEILNIFQRT